MLPQPATCTVSPSGCVATTASDLTAGRWRATSRTELDRRLDALDVVASTAVDRLAALGLWARLWTTEAAGGGHVSGTAAQLARQVGVDPRTLRRLLRLLDRSGLLVPAPGGWRVPDPKQLEGVEGARGSAGFEQDPRGAFRVAADRVAASLTAAGQRSSGLPVLTALGAYTVLRLRHAPWRGNDRTRPVTVGGRRRPAPGVQVAAVLGLHRSTWARLGQALVGGGLVEPAGRGYVVTRLVDLHAAPTTPACTPAAGVQAHLTDTPTADDVHLTDSPGRPEVHPTGSSERAHKTLPEHPSQKDPASAGPAAVEAVPDRPAPPPRVGRHGDHTQDVDDNHNQIKSKSSPQEETGEHPDLAQTVSEIITSQPAFSAIGRPGHPARAVLDRALHDGVDLYSLISMSVNGGYACGSRWPAAVLARNLPAAIAKGRYLDRQRTAQLRYGSGRPVAVALNLDTSDECAHGARSCTVCPACRNGRPDDLTGQPCRCHTPYAAPQQPVTAPQAAAVSA